MAWSDAARQAALEVRRRRAMVRAEPVNLQSAIKGYASIGHDLAKHNSYLRRDAAAQLRAWRKGGNLQRRGKKFYALSSDLGVLHSVLQTSRVSTLARNAARAAARAQKLASNLVNRVGGG